MPATGSQVQEADTHHPVVADHASEHQRAAVRRPAEAQQVITVATRHGAVGPSIRGDDPDLAIATDIPRVGDVAPIGGPCGKPIGHVLGRERQLPRQGMFGRLQHDRRAADIRTRGRISHERRVGGQAWTELEAGRRSQQQPRRRCRREARMRRGPMAVEQGPTACRRHDGHGCRDPYPPPRVSPGRASGVDLSSPGCRCGRRRVMQPLHRHHQPVSGLGDRLDVSRRAALLLEDPSQVGDRLGEDIVGGRGIRPRRRQQRLTCHHFPLPVRQGLQNRQCLGRHAVGQAAFARAHLPAGQVHRQGAHPEADTPLPRGSGAVPVRVDHRL